MERAFFPGPVFGPGPFFHPFFQPFVVPRRRFFPFFVLTPFGFPFSRNENPGDQVHAQHQCQGGDTLAGLAQQYNCPQPILEAMNPHVQHPEALMPGTVVNIPRLDRMFCHKMYLEHEAVEASAVPAAYPTAATYGGTGYPHPMYPGQ